jgi:hypothetical protein
MNSKGPSSVRTTILLTLAIAVLMFLRRPDSLLNAQFWAEDGAVFFHDQLRYGFLQALSTSYAGYFQPLQRTIAALSSWLPVRDIPLAYSLCATIIDAACCATFYLPRYRALIASDSLRMSLCILAAIGSDGRELVAIALNSVWFLTLLGVVLIARPPEPRTRLTASLDLLLAFVIGLSAPNLVIVAPIAFWRLLREPRRFSTLFTIAVAFGAVSQSFVAFFSGAVVAHAGVKLDSLIFTVLQMSTYKVVMQSLIGFPATMVVAQQQMFGIVLAALVTTIAFFTWMLTVLEAEDRRRTLGAIFIIYASVAVPLAARGLIVHNLSDFMPGAPRYFYVGSCVFMYLVALAIDRKLPLSDNRWKSAVLFAAFAGGIYGNYRIERFVDFNWPHQASKVRLWMRYQQFSDLRAPSVSVPINPPGWSIELPAREPSR